MSDPQPKSELPQDIKLKTEILASLFIGLGFIALGRWGSPNSMLLETAAKIDLLAGWEDLKFYLPMAVGGGVVGGAFRRLRDVIIGGGDRMRGRLLPFFGGFVGAAFLLVFYVVPSLMGLAKIEYSPLFLTLLCALSSMFHERTWEVLGAFFGKYRATDREGVQLYDASGSRL